MADSDDFHILDPKHTDPARVKKEREKAQKLKKSQWWLEQVSRGICHYCGNQFPASEITMDHVVPIARGGRSNPGNIVPACRSCNRDKKLSMPVEDAFAQLEKERRARAEEPGDDSE